MVKTWQVVLATLGIFLAGLVAGGASALGLVRWMAHHPHVNPAGLGMLLPRAGQAQQFSPQLMRSFANQLDLTDDQRARIMPIVRRTVGQLGRERRELQLSSALAVEKMQDEISEILTPEQRSKFEALVAQQRAKLRQLRQSGQPQPPVSEPPAQQAPK
jgi:Spy/CpxP family protein refolding chaperone